ncbi:hypothetical protein LA345_36480 (plasmid) [Burkholderia vietnamiensis]|uniref:Uncharacterized protein n=1 Tax=Burkholderia vietnamiensis (strain G4 / LMG 22486) TaxID=269482 RepID=A4JVS0_BURVG|nr:hypothetical protein Bcep1808_7498 [Burkholderia vietnamiensis G4]MCB4349309.1 hypothetical protein [Burkholderia vietnamiensis]
MSSRSFLYALQKTGVYLNGRSWIEEQLLDVQGWQRLFVEMVVADHARLLLRPATYGVEKWSDALNKIVAVLREYAFDDADIDRVIGAIHADSEIALVEIEIVRIKGASDPNLPSHLFPGCGSDYVLFQLEVSDSELVISPNAVADAIVDLEMDAGLNEFDPDTRTGSYYIVDGASEFAAGTRFLLGLNLSDPVTLLTDYVLRDYPRFDERDLAMPEVAVTQGTSHEIAETPVVGERHATVDQSPRVSVEKLSGERTILIRESNAFALLRWPDYRLVRRLSVRKALDHGEAGFNIWLDRSTTELPGAGDLVASCRSHSEALGLLAAIEAAILAESDPSETLHGSAEANAQGTVAAPDRAASPHWAVVVLLGCAAVCGAIVAMPILFGAGDAVAKRLFPDPRPAQALHSFPPALQGPGFLAPPLQPLPTVPRGRVNG